MAWGVGRLSARLFKLFLFFMALAFGGGVQAAVEADDPSGVLARAKEFLGASSFAREFRVGDAVVLKAFVIGVESVDCDEYQCSATLKEVADGPADVRREIASSSDSEAVVQSDVGELSIVDAREFEAAGDAASYFVQGLDRFLNFAGARVRMSEARDATYAFARGTPRERSVPALHLSGEIGRPGQRQLPFLLTVVRDAPGIAKIVRFRFHERTFFLAHDFAEGAPR